jgi:predicted ATPase
VKILTTTREPLRLASEHVYPVGSLAVPGPDEAGLADVPASALFIDRATARDPAFRLTKTNQSWATESAPVPAADSARAPGLRPCR